MQFEFMKPWGEFGNISYASLKELGEISTKALEKMAEQQLTLVSTCADTGVKHVALMTESKGYKDFLAGQTKLMSEYNEKMLDAVRKTTEIVTDSKDEMAAWFENTLENGTAAVKEAALDVKKASEKTLENGAAPARKAAFEVKKATA